MVEPVGNRVIAAVGEHLFRARNGERRVPCDAPRHTRDFCQHRVLISEHPVHEPARLGLGRIHRPAGIGELAGKPVGHHARQPLEGAEIGGHADLDFLDHEIGVLGAVAHIAGRDHVDAAADTAALHGGQHRQVQTFQHIEAVLQLEHHAAQILPTAAIFDAAVRHDEPRQQGEIDAGGEMRPGRRDHHGARLRRLRDPRHRGGQLAPKGGRHGVPLLRAVQGNPGNAVLDRDDEAFVVSRGSLLPARAAHDLLVPVR